MKLRRAPYTLPPWRPSEWVSKALIAAGVGVYLLLMYRLVVATQEKGRSSGSAVFDKEETLPMPRVEAQRPTPGELSSLEMIPLLPLVEDKNPPPAETPLTEPAPSEEPEAEPPSESSDTDERPDWAKADPAPEAAAGTPPRRTLTPRGPQGENTSKATTAAFLSNPKPAKTEETDGKPAPPAAAPPKPAKKPRVFRDMLGNAEKR